MEYMLMPDGSVEVFHKIDTKTEVLEMLALYGGLGYYWNNDSFGWRKIEPGSNDSDLVERLKDAEVPDVIKLAHMLQ